MHVVTCLHQYKNYFMNTIFFNIIWVSFIVLLLSCDNSKKTMSVNSALREGNDSEMLFHYEWSLTEVQGIAVPSTTTFKPFFLMARGHPNFFNGNTSCNFMKGNFELSGTNGIKFRLFAT